MAEGLIANAQTFKEECEATRQVIRGINRNTREILKDMDRKLDDFMILFSHKFQVSVPIECFSKEYSATFNQIGVGNYKEELNKLKQVKSEEFCSFQKKIDQKSKSKLIEGSDDLSRHAEQGADRAFITQEEVTASLEELRQRRIIELHFADVQKAPMLPSREPKELTKLEENRSRKGVAGICEEVYAQSTGPVSTVLSFLYEQKQEARLLFIEDMLIQTKEPALAMEKIAPTAASEVVILTP